MNEVAVAEVLLDCIQFRLDPVEGSKPNAPAPGTVDATKDEAACNICGGKRAINAG